MDFHANQTSELRVRLVPCNRFKSSSKIFLLAVPRRYFFCGSFVFLCLVFFMLSRLFIAALWSPVGKGLTSWLLLLILIVFLLTPLLVSWARCGTWLYRFLIFAVFLTFIQLPDAICDFQQRGILTSLDSNEPVYPPYKFNNSK